jgi:hypothetical protein
MVPTVGGHSVGMSPRRRRSATTTRTGSSDSAHPASSAHNRSSIPVRDANTTRNAASSPLTDERPDRLPHPVTGPLAITLDVEQRPGVTVRRVIQVLPLRSAAGVAVLEGLANPLEDGAALGAARFCRARQEGEHHRGRPARARCRVSRSTSNTAAASRRCFPRTVRGTRCPLATHFRIVDAFRPANRAASAVVIHTSRPGVLIGSAATPTTRRGCGR